MVGLILKPGYSQLHYLPVLYVMGEQDYILLEPVKDLVNRYKSRSLAIIEKCGHVVNIEKADVFNQVSIEFIQNLKNRSGLAIG